MIKIKKLDIIDSVKKCLEGEENMNCEYDEIVIKNWEKIRSKHKTIIIQLISEYPGISHKELAEKMGITPSGLTPIMNKFRELNTPIVRIKLSGKKKVYSLDVKAKNVFQKMWIFEKKEDKKNPEDGSLVNILTTIKEQIGKPWTYYFEEYLLGRYDHGGEYFQLFQTLDININKSIINGLEDEVVRLLKNIDNEIIVIRLQQKSKQISSEYEKVKPLCELDNSYTIDSFILVEKICDLIKHKKLEKDNELSEQFDIEKEKISLLLETIKNLYETYEEPSVEDIYEEMKWKFPEKNQKMLYFLIWNLFSEKGTN